MGADDRGWASAGYDGFGKRLANFLLFVVVAVSLAACVPQKSYTWSLIVEVEQAGTVKRGVSVRKTIRELDSLPIIDTRQDYVRGEALALPMSGGGVLIFPVSLRGGNKEWGPKDYESLPRCSRSKYGLEADAFSVGGVVSERDYPPMLMFSDIADPESVKVINSEELEEIYGGASLRRVMVCRGKMKSTGPRIAEVLPWLSERMKVRDYLTGEKTDGPPGTPDRVSARDLILR